jgi:uncharacterized protein YlxW (UPF0749 family)
MNWDIALPMTSIVLTVLLAWVGIEMANKPPTTNTQKWAYRSAFILFGSLLVGVNYVQSKHNVDEQTRIRNDANREQQKIDAQYNQVKQQLADITKFVAQPPPNLDSNEVAAVVRAMSGMSGKSELPRNLLPIIPDETLTVIADHLKTRLSEIRGRFDRDDNHLYAKETNQSLTQNEHDQLQEERKQLRAKIFSDNRELFSYAQAVSDECAKRPAISQETSEIMAAIANFEKVPCC